MFKKLPYARFTLIHKPSGRHLLDVPERAFDAMNRRIEELRRANGDMSEYRLRKRLILTEEKSETGGIRRTSRPADDKTYPVDMLPAMLRLGIAL